jgi:hypothetical protein
MSTSVPYHIALSKNEAYTHTHIYQSIIALSSPGTKWPCLEYVSVLDTSKCKKSQVHELFPFFSPNVSPLKKRSVLHDEILALVTCSRRIWSWWSMTTIKSSHRNLTLKTAPHGGWPGESHILCVWTWWNYPIKKDTLGRNNDDKSLVFVWCVWCVCPSFWQTHIYGLKKDEHVETHGWWMNKKSTNFDVWPPLTEDLWLGCPPRKHTIFSDESWGFCFLSSGKQQWSRFMKLGLNDWDCVFHHDPQSWLVNGMVYGGLPMFATLLGGSFLSSMVKTIKNQQLL